MDIINDAEIPSVIYSTFKDLGFDSFTIRINNRKVLSGFFKSLGISDSTGVLRAVDKLEKIGIDKVMEELGGLGLTSDKIHSIIEFISIKGSNDEIISKLKGLNIDDELFVEGINELEKTVEYIRLFGVPEVNFALDLTIARGLDYYTGTVYETLLNDYPSIGSVCSGGRYDDLATYYTKQKLPGVGISIGLTRLFYQLTEAGIIKSSDYSLTKVMIIPMDGYMDYAIKASKILRDNGVFTQVYFENGKIGKKFNYADKLNIPYVIVAGKDEVENDKYSFRDMKTGEQKNISMDEILQCLK